MILHKKTVFLFLAAASLMISGCGGDSKYYNEPESTGTRQTEHAAENPASPSNSIKVLEYTPAPGQYINDSATGGMPADITTPREAALWAETRLEKRLFVSLGAFGGYITIGFEHEVINSLTDYDFAIFGNAFLGSGGSGGSNEPGIVYVMEDTNGNGLADDVWYELRGSETEAPSTLRDYSVTYQRPAEAGQPVEWTDNLGNTGTIDYLKAFHKQDYYYPAWIAEDSYTLSGTRLEARTECDPETGMWSTNAFGGGYADNMGSDNTAFDGMAQTNRFRISDAIDASGAPVRLHGIHFVKVQTGVCSKAGHLGEISTEVLGFADLMTEPDDSGVPMIR